MAEGEAADIDAAVAAARTAMAPGSPWTRMTRASASVCCNRVADLVDKHVDELAQLESLDNGKALKVARHGDIPSVAAFFATWPAGPAGSTGDRFRWWEHRPACSTPLPCASPSVWSARSSPGTFRSDGGVEAGAGLCCGNAVVLKPAEQTPLSALRLGELLCQAGLPDGVVNIVTGFGETAELRWLDIHRSIRSPSPARPRSDG